MTGGDEPTDEHDEVADRRDPADEAGEDGKHDQQRNEDAAGAVGKQIVRAGAGGDQRKGQRRDHGDQRDPTLPVDACVHGRVHRRPPPMRHITRRSVTPTAVTSSAARMEPTTSADHIWIDWL